MRARRLILTIAGLCLLDGDPGSARARGEEPKSIIREVTYRDARGYVCERASGPITVDGRLDEPSWAAVPWTETFVDIEGDTRPRPRFDTRVKMLWDDQFFYIAARLEEPHVWGTLTEHDSVIFHDNDFEVFLDPDGDNHEYYEFEINALNTGWDLRLVKPYRDGGPALNAWEIPGLKSAVHVQGTLNDPSDEDEAWTVELAFPWAVLAEFAGRPTPPRDGDQWRINFSRVQWRHAIVDGQYRKVADTREDNWVWSPQGAIDMHRPERWGYVQFSTTPVGVTVFRPDPAAPTRDLLTLVYHAQRAYHGEHGAWADSVDALDLDFPDGAPKPRVQRTPDGFEAQLDMAAEAGQPAQVWTIRQDSRTWAERGDATSR